MDTYRNTYVDGTTSKEFLLKWADLNAQKKARTKFATSIKQTTSVRRYAELFEDLILEADFHDPTMLALTKDSNGKSRFGGPHPRYA